MIAHEQLMNMLTRLHLTAIRDQLDSLLDEAARQELTLRETLAFLCQREIARKDERRIQMGTRIAHFLLMPAEKLTSKRGVYRPKTDQGV
jgi:DNA replication protein DnaC